MFYLSVFFILAFFAFLEVNLLAKKYLKYLEYIVGFIFITIAGLRYETGVDWRAYQDYLNSIPAFDVAILENKLGDVFISLDLGFALLNSIVKMFGGGLQTIFFIVSVLSTVLLIRNLRYYCNYVLTGLFIYYSFFFFIFDLSGLRQGLSIQIMLFSIKFIDEKKIKSFLGYILLATSIHWSSILILPLYFFLRKKMHLFFVFLLLIISLFVFLLQIKWLDAILGSLLDKLNFLALVSGKIDAYSTNETLAQTRIVDMFSIYNYVRIAVLIIICNFHSNKLSKEIKGFIIFYNFLLIELFCFFCLYEFVQISERLRFYFFISEVILIPHILFLYKFYIYRYFTFFTLSIIIFLNSYPYLINAQSTTAYYPYQNYLVYKLFDISSDGNNRLDEHERAHK